MKALWASFQPLEIPERDYNHLGKYTWCIYVFYVQQQSMKWNVNKLNIPKISNRIRFVPYHNHIISRDITYIIYSRT